MPSLQMVCHFELSAKPFFKYFLLGVGVAFVWGLGVRTFLLNYRRCLVTIFVKLVTFLVRISTEEF